MSERTMYTWRVRVLVSTVGDPVTVLPSETTMTVLGFSPDEAPDRHELALMWAVQRGESVSLQVIHAWRAEEVAYNV